MLYREPVAARRTQRQHAAYLALQLATRAAALIEELGPPLHLAVAPELSVVVLERDGWQASDWNAWAASALADGLAFVTPTSWHGRPAGRLALVHRATEFDAVAELLRRAHA